MELKRKKIIVPIDYSETSINALEYAIRSIGDRDAEIFLMHAAEIPYPTGMAYGVIEAGYTSDMIAETVDVHEEKLRKLGEKYGSTKIAFKTICIVGSLMDWIREQLPSLEPDLVIMGTTGASGLKEIFIGSTTEKVVRFACCPVIAIPHSTKWEPIRNIIVPFEDKLASWGFYQRLSQMQEGTNARIQVIWIKTHHSNEHEEDKLNEMIRLIESYGLKNFSVNVRRSFSVPAGIISFVEEINGDLIAMPTNGRSGLAHLFNESVAETVVNKSFVPVWTYNIGVKVPESV